MNCTRADTAPSCDITKVADGTCDPGCMSPECLFDGGDCANNQIAKSFPRDLRQTFTLLDAHLSLDTDDHDSSWLDSTPDAFIDSTRRRCDDAESWTKTETILEDVDMTVHDSSNFGGFDFSVLAQLINVPKSNSKYPRAANGDKVEFRASVSLGCDQYEKELKENLFKFYTPTEFRYFLNEMRKLTARISSILKKPCRTNGRAITRFTAPATDAIASAVRGTPIAKMLRCRHITVPAPLTCAPKQAVALVKRLVGRLLRLRLRLW